MPSKESKIMYVEQQIKRIDEQLNKYKKNDAGDIAVTLQTYLARRQLDSEGYTDEGNNLTSEAYNDLTNEQDKNIFTLLVKRWALIQNNPKNRIAKNVRHTQNVRRTHRK